MKDCAGAHHPDDEPVTWRQFDREMAHHAQLQTEKERAIRDAVELRARQMLLSHRILIVVVTAIAVVLQLIVFLRR